MENKEILEIYLMHKANHLFEKDGTNITAKDIAEILDNNGVKVREGIIRDSSDFDNDDSGMTYYFPKNEIEHSAFREKIKKEPKNELHVDGINVDFRDVYKEDDFKNIYITGFGTFEEELLRIKLRYIVFEVNSTQMERSKNPEVLCLDTMQLIPLSHFYNGRSDSISIVSYVAFMGKYGCDMIDEKDVIAEHPELKKYYDYFNKLQNVSYMKKIKIELGDVSFNISAKLDHTDIISDN